MFSALIVPTEFSPSLLEIKRALLTYDTVYLIDPSERDMFPPQAIMQSLLGLPLIGLNMGPVRPLGKGPSYDNDFERCTDLLKLAVQQGSVRIIRTYPDITGQVFIGHVPMGDYPLNPQFVLAAYRSAARDNGFLEAAIANDGELLSLSDDIITSLALPGGMADGEINNAPRMPNLTGPLIRENLRGPLSEIARARVGATLKTMGYCAKRDVVPYSSSKSLHNIMRYMTDRAMTFIDSRAGDDPLWIHRSRALRLAHAEYLDETVLEKMSIADTLSCRTAAWGQQAEARDRLMKAVGELARDIGCDKDFDSRCRDRIHDYRIRAAELESERATLRMKIDCEVVKGMAAAGAIITGGSIAQVQTGLGVATLLLGGCVYAFQKVQDYAPLIANLSKAEEQFRGDACFGLHNFYRPA